MIPYGRQSISEADIEAVVEVLRSDFLTQGPVVPRFEQAVADYCGARFGVAVNSGTAALHIACLALVSARVTGSGPPPSALSPRPTALSIAEPKSISSTSSPIPATCAPWSWSASW